MRPYQLPFSFGGVRFILVERFLLTAKEKEGIILDDNHIEMFKNTA